MGQAAGALTINVEANGALGHNAAALAAIQRAVATWEGHLADPVSLRVAVSLEALTPVNSIGSATPVALAADYTAIRDQWVADASLESGGSITAFLPSAGDLSLSLPDGFGHGGLIEATKANLKAIGFQGLDETFGEIDGSIVFNEDFAFDFDNSDGVGPGLVDFEGAALHELAHVLGFISAVDLIDFTQAANEPRLVNPHPFDLMRFAAGDVPANAADFSEATRNLIPGDEAAFWFGEGAGFSLSTGLELGDGRQASHWRDDELSGQLIGMMDPTLNLQQEWSVTPVDLAVLDAIGWELIVPEPSSGTLLLFGLFSYWRRPRFPAG
jgi:hypothetical protein